MRQDRLNKIEEYILKNGTVSWDELTGQFQVSLNTIRRDIGELLQRGRICKVYGGVTVTESVQPVTFSERSEKNMSAKEIIGRAAAGLVRDGQTIFLDSGTTVPCIIRHLAGREGITIVTGSLKVIDEVVNYPSLKLISLGGCYNAETVSFAGVSGPELLSHISTDIAFMAATGVTLKRGLTHTTFFEAETKRKVVQNSEKIVLMADHTKFDTASSLTFCKFEQLSAVVTDKTPPEAYLEAIRRGNMQLLTGE